MNSVLMWMSGFMLGIAFIGVVEHRNKQELKIEANDKIVKCHGVLNGTKKAN